MSTAIIPATWVPCLSEASSTKEAPPAVLAPTIAPEESLKNTSGQEPPPPKMSCDGLTPESMTAMTTGSSASAEKSYAEEMRQLSTVLFTPSMSRLSPSRYQSPVLLSASVFHLSGKRASATCAEENKKPHASISAMTNVARHISVLLRAAVIVRF